MKKRTSLFILCIMGCLGVSAHQFRITYDYDNAGNRISRKVITLMSSRVSTDSISKPKDDISSSLLACKVAVYPNPTEGEVTLSISNGPEEEIAEITTYDNSGQLLINRSAKGNTSVSIDLSPYPNGIYLINFRQGESKSFYKIIKK